MKPVIICGMHRSGTSLICRSLEAAGLFTGQEKEENHESVFFLALNQWIFDQLGASWDNPYNMNFLNEELGGYLLAVIANILNSASAATYTGDSPEHSALFSTDNDIAWGWKDPRNTYTAGLWAGLFPDARIIHVCRNPLDVAESLRLREHQIMQRHKTQLAAMGPDQLDGTMRFQQSPRLFNLTEGLALWEEYTLQAVALEQQFGTRALRVRYEDFLANPGTELARMARFAGLRPDPVKLQAATDKIDPSRRYAFTRDDELVSVYRDYRERYIMKMLGYDRIENIDSRSGEHIRTA